ncbi:copper amine oxidase N-terminal domain-containing protein [Abyssisolibacter fermentans]|uniref:copper amine oxidase N-terminal domain-containing protein n=1 Tax=Abyssisolibacter fermentans TaxID=1766203 RepID=UPI00082DE485|nr:copper amine oxidase N-terminal domain-containing protein [Abyssisolibacter fermentans]
MSKKIFSITLILIIVLTSAVCSFAADGKQVVRETKKIKDSQLGKVKNIKKEKVMKNEEEKEIDENNNVQEWEKTKNELEIQKDEAEKLKDELEAKYEVAKESGDLELATQLKSELDASKEQFKSLKNDMHSVILERKAMIKSKYTEEEMQKLKEAEEKIIEDQPEAKILPVDSIFSKSAKFKFDTPPVIKYGRTLIPVRAITEGFKANVEWKPDTKEAVVTKGETEIVLQLDSNIAIVNGEEIELDVKSGMLNNRMYVPLRFILENLGLKIDWDEENETIEIDEEENEADEENQDSDTDEQIQDDETDEQVQDSDADEQIQDDESDEQVQDSDTDEQIQDDESDEQVQDSDADEQIQDDETDEQVQDNETVESIQ